MKNNIIKLIFGGILVGAILIAPCFQLTSHAQISDGLNKAGAADVSKTSVDNIVKNVVNILLFAVGVIAVVMMIIGGAKYISSNGDANKINAAKQTILYSIIGLVVAICAYAIVKLVVDNIK